MRKHPVSMLSGHRKPGSAWSIHRFSRSRNSGVCHGLGWRMVVADGRASSGTGPLWTGRCAPVPARESLFDAPATPGCCSVRAARRTPPTSLLATPSRSVPKRRATDLVRRRHARVRSEARLHCVRNVSTQRTWLPRPRRNETRPRATNTRSPRLVRERNPFIRCVGGIHTRKRHNAG